MTASYTTGTVSVVAGNAVVTGVGTAWLTSGLVAGQFGLDSANGNPIPVLSIDSDTQITLVKPWRGTNAAGQAYWITYDTRPGQQTVSNAQKLAEYIARLDKPTLAALAGLTPAADKIAYFTGPNGAALTDFNAAARALLAGGQIPNSQIRNDLSQDKAFRRGNILGLVSQSGGVPTGEVFERGSNGNGEYTRFADGTQICFGFANLGYFNSSELSTTKNFPAAFSFSPGLSVTATFNWPSGSPRSVPMYVRQNGITPTYFLASATNPSNNNQSGDLFQIVYTAMGRWF